MTTKTAKKTKGFKLVIVESPTKAKTIAKFLGDDFKVESSFGHIRDLPKSKLGIDTEKDFEPHYIIPVKAKKRVGELKKLADKAGEVILATDEDREGEAIAWHLTFALGLDAKIAKRIVFHEITEDAIKEAVANPRNLDLKLVDAQQARRILDRLVGYELSPFLWKKIFKGLSAGRVQSAAVRMIIEREREIQKFVPQEYWSVIATLQKSNLKSQISNQFESRLIKKDGKLLDKLEIKNKDEADKILKDLESAKYAVSKVEKKEINRSPSPPFTTSTLQQDAYRKLGFSSRVTMMVAQQLYEHGHITYMRTDSVNLSAYSLDAAQKVINAEFGKECGLARPRYFKNKAKGAQEAHEAIRPSDPRKTPAMLSSLLEPKQLKLYDLIWRRFIASQMQLAVFDATSIDINAKNYTFRTSGITMKFGGWLKVYPTAFEEKNLPEIKEGEILDLVKITPSQHFTEPPARYNEASLVRAMEEYGIGRPSTYAPTISTIQTRNYVEKNEQKRFVPTETGIMVDDILVEHFPDIVNLQFTAKMEEDLDEIAEGKKEWTPVIKDFYEPFHKNLQSKYESVVKQKTDEATDETCEKCGKPMIIKHGRFGRFMACSGFPDCKNTKNIKKETQSLGIMCPKCNDGEIVVKRTRSKRIFYGCTKYPTCDFASWKKPGSEKK